MSRSAPACRKPAPVPVGLATAYAIRPPSASDPRWYWQALGPAIDGRRPTLWSGRATPDEAALALARVVAEHGARPDADAVREAREVAEGITVAQLLARWIAHVEAMSASYSPNTVETYRLAGRHLTSVLGGYSIREITPALLERYYADRVAAGWQPGTASIALRNLRTGWNWGFRNRLHAEPWPRPALRLPDRTEHPRPDALQIADLLLVVRRDAPSWVYRLAAVIAGTGMRVSEAWGLLCRDVTVERQGRTVLGGSLSIQGRKGIAKTGARTVFIAAGLAAEIGGWVESMSPSDRLVGDVTHLTAITKSYKYVEGAAKAAGCPWTGWHSLRRAAADGYAEAGVDPVVAAAQLGHSVQMMQQVYRSVRGAHKQAAADALARSRAAAAGPALRVVHGEDDG
jgi:integrase